jgi:hypothetical protein
LITGIARASERPLGGAAERLLFVSFADMVMFAGFFVPAIMWSEFTKGVFRLAGIS